MSEYREQMPNLARIRDLESRVSALEEELDVVARLDRLGDLENRVEREAKLLRAISNLRSRNAERITALQRHVELLMNTSLQEQLDTLQHRVNRE